jgi:tetratricopeptide (TPR) repeat protein
MSGDSVSIWQEEIIIPTYGIGKPDKNPLFLEKRVYQGSSGAVYPHTVIDRVFDHKFDKTYQAVFLENRYLKIMILPELGGRVQDDSGFMRFVRRNPNTYIEISLDYAHAGLYDDAIELLRQSPLTDPMVPYFTGWYQAQNGDMDDARATFLQAAQNLPNYGFPNQLECVPALETAIRLNPPDAYALYMLGNFWYGHRRHAEAIAAWEQSRVIDATFPTVHRNLGLAYYNQLHDADRAQQALEQAFTLDPTDARVYFELDHLRKKHNMAPQTRFDLLKLYPGLIAQRDDLMVEWITLHNLIGRSEEAYQLIASHRFHPWEGGEGKITTQYVTCLVENAKHAMSQLHFDQAIKMLERAQEYPPNLGEGKLPGVQENQIYYYLGLAYEAMANKELAATCLQKASTGLSEASSALFYNDQPPDMLAVTQPLLPEMKSILEDMGAAAKTPQVRLLLEQTAGLMDSVTLNPHHTLHCIPALQKRW